jgi:SAM-dependent methyltransferase
VRRNFHGEALNLSYLLPRLARRLLPEKLVRALLLRSWIIRPGLETSDPQAAVQRYVDVLVERGLSLKGRRVLVFGYGGRFDIGLGILQAGAAHVLLSDKFASPDEAHNQHLFSTEKKYFSMQGYSLRPRTEWMTLSGSDIKDAAMHGEFAPVDVVMSNSVYEHLDDVEGITRALAALTRPDGINIHFIDLRDHFFKYPFEMLRFSDRVWYGWLNPSSNHNRYRLWDYRRVFQACFGETEIKVLARDEEAFRRIQPHVLPKFISADTAENAVTLIRVVAEKPRISR